MSTIQKGKILRDDLHLYDGVQRTATRIDSTGGTITGNTIGDVVDILTVYGADYTARNASTINAAVLAVGSKKTTFELSTGSWNIADAITVPSNVTIVIPAGCDVTFTSAPTLSGVIIIDGTLTVNSTITSTGVIYNNGTLTVSSAATIASNIINTSSIVISAATTLSGSIVNGVGATITESSAITATGKIRNDGTITISTATTIAADISGFGSLSITAATTLSGDILIEPGGKITIASGITVTMSGNLEAGVYQIFFGTGTVNLTGTCSAAYVEWWGAVADDSTNCTYPIQYVLRMAAGICKTYFQSGIYKVDGDAILTGNTAKRGIHIPSNSELILKQDTVIEMIATTSYVHNVMCIYNVDNVTIRGGTIYGDMDAPLTRDFPSSYNGIGLRIQGSDNVFIHDLKATKMYTDGIAIVYDDENSPYPECTNVHLINCSATYNYRNGCSVIGCIGGSIRGGNYTNNAGTTPQSGIDVEPNANNGSGGPSTVSDFEVTGVYATANYQGIVCDAAGTVTRLSMHHNISTANTGYGMIAKDLTDSQVVNNIVTNNPSANLLVYGTTTTMVDGNIDGQAAISAHSTLNQSLKSQAVRLQTSGIYTGIKVFDATDINFGTDDFTIYLQIGLGDWTPGSTKYLYWKESGAAPNAYGLVVAVSATGKLVVYLYRNDSGTTYTSLANTSFADNSVHAIGISVTRETGGANGSIALYLDGKWIQTHTITAAATVTLTNTGNMHIGGLDTNGHQKCTIQNVILYNKALTAAEQLALYRDGIADGDRWGEQTTPTYGCIFALEPENIQPVPGLWFDSSTNLNHGRHPVGASLLAKPKKDFEIRWTNTWAASSSAQYLGDDNSPILPSSNIRIDSISCVLVSGAATIEVGDGSDVNRFVTSVALSAGLNELTVANRNHDGTNRDVAITPTGSMTAVIDTFIRGSIL